MYIALFFIFLPTSITYKYYPPEVKRIIFGDLGNMEDLFLPESTDDVTDSEMDSIPKIDIKQLCSDSYVEPTDPSDLSKYEEPENITGGEDAREYNEVLVKYNFTRKRVWYWWQGHYDRDDWWLGNIIEEKKIKMFQKISLMYLYHTRYKIAFAFRQREEMRRDKRYMLGYLFNRLRRLKTEMLKLVAIARQQFYEYGGFKRQFENLTAMMRLYERVVRHDIDIRDTSAFIKQIFHIRQPYDFIAPDNGAGGGKAQDATHLAQQEQAALAPKNLDFGEQRYELLLGIKIVASLLDLSPSRQVPHAKVLRNILKANLIPFSDTKEGNLLDYLFNAKELSNKTDNFDFDVLNIENIRKIIEVAKKKYYAELPKDSRKRRETIRHNPHIIEMVTKQMQQSIFGIRYRLQSTLYLRKHYGGDISYQIAILIGSIQQIVLKMDNLLAQSRHFPTKTHLLWILIIYEKLLAGNIDVNLMVKRVFHLHSLYMERFKGMQDAAENAEK